MKDSNRSLTKEEIEKAVNDVFNTIKPPRQFKLFAGCRTHGLINIAEQYCNDPQCSPCSAFREALKDWKLYEKD